MTESAALAAFVAGTISFAALRNALSDSTVFVFQPGGGINITSSRPLPHTVIRPCEVRRALARYRDGELTIEELSIWGLTLQALDSFEVVGTVDMQEETWEVIAQLAVASVNTAFNQARVAQLLVRMELLTDDSFGTSR